MDTIYITSINSTSNSLLRQNLIKWQLVLLFSLLATTIIIILFINIFIQRIITIKNTIHNVSIENYDITLTKNGKDELSEILVDFQTIMNNLLDKETDLFLAKIKEQQLINKQQQIEFNLLNNQINPHFLFNTLENIRMLVIQEDNKEAAFAIQLLAKCMRYTIDVNGKNETPLSEELSYIEVYLSIQRLRFDERVNYSIIVDRSVNPENTIILPLLIQPIVENSIKHGLESIDRRGDILIKIKIIEKNFLKIEIFDNGLGMPPWKLKKLHDKLSSLSIQNTKNIGLLNVNTRLKLHYGNNSGIFIESTENAGTKVILTIPLKIISK